MIFQPIDLLAAIPLAQGDSPFGLSLLPLVMIIAALFYFMILRPEGKRRSAQEKMHKELKKNDRIITIGGLYGTVVNVQQGADDITIKVDETSNTRLRITRSSVQTVLHKEKESGEKKEAS